MEQTLYPLGFLAALLFGARVVLQWIASEKEQKSVVTKNFWILSIIANLCMTVHSLIQLQLPLMLVQAGQGVLSWRNLDLMGPKPKQRSLPAVIWLLAGIELICLTLFIYRCTFFENWSLMRVPKGPWDHSPEEFAPLMWQIVGIAGIILFASRFWVQWIFAEKKVLSHFSEAFWWISLVGALLSLAYFAKINDIVNLLGPALGLLPYARNLLLVRRGDS